MSSTTNTLAKKYSAASFFRFNFRQNIQHLVLYLVITVLVMVLPTIMMIENYYDSVDSDFETYRSYLIRDAVEMIATIGLFVSGGIAVLSGMSSLAYVNSKQNVGCYHSFPIKRETMYLTDSLTRVIYYAVTMLFGYTVPYVILIVALPPAPVLQYGGTYLKYILAGIIAFLLIYSVFLLAASLTGTAVMRFIMAGMIFFLPAAIYAIMVVTICMANSDIYDAYYWNEEIIQYICTPVRAVYGLDEMLNDNSFVKLLMLIPEAAVYYTAGLFLHKFRKSESTGTTLIWKPVFMFIKYVVIILCTLLGAYIFYNIEETVISFFVGAIIGAVLSLILMNCLLYRSSRAMFKGIKPFGICCAATAVFMIFVPLNVTGQIGRYYSAANTKALTIRLSSSDLEVTFDKREDIESMLALLGNEKAMFSGDLCYELPVFDTEENQIYCELDYDRTLEVYTKEYGYTEEDIKAMTASVGKNRYSLDNYSMVVTQKPNVGVPLTVCASSDANSLFMETLLSTEQAGEAMDLAANINFDNVEEVTIDLDNRRLSVLGKGQPEYFDAEYYCSYYENGVTYEFSSDEIWDKVFEIMELCKYNVTTDWDSTIVGQINFYCREDNTTKCYEYPICASNLEILNKITALMTAARNDDRSGNTEWQPYASSVEYFRDAAELRADDNSLILLVDCRTGEAVEITAEEFAQLGEYTVSYLFEDSWSLRHLMRYSTTEYAMLFQLESERDIVVRFRKDAISDGALAEYFAK